MKRIFSLLLTALFALSTMAQTAADWQKMAGTLNFFMCNDMGRNGYYDQKNIAELMGQMAEEIGPECVFAAGDVHHFYGVASTQDPLWTTNYEAIYAHPELMIPWYPILGNHEYRGNTQAVLDYAGVSRRWMMPARYYTKVFEDDGVSVRFIMIDTSPLITRYRSNAEKYPDAGRQAIEPQLKWLEEQLAAAKEDWVIVMGHHPIYAETPKTESERTDLQRLLAPVLKRHKVDIYACGHIHNFQHLRVKGSTTDFVVNSAASLARKVNAIDGTVFCSSEPGFSVIAATKNDLRLTMVDKQGRALHTVLRQK